MEVKQYPCCTGLDFIGGIWTGIVISGTFTFVQCILGMILIGNFDKLQLPRCCGWYAGKRGDAVLLKLNGSGNGGVDTVNARHVEAPASVPEPAVMNKAPPPAAGRPSRIFFGGVGRSSADEVISPPIISITADSTTRATQQPFSKARRRSSGLPPPSAPQWE